MTQPHEVEIRCRLNLSAGAVTKTYSEPMQNKLRLPLVSQTLNCFRSKHVSTLVALEICNDCVCGWVGAGWGGSGRLETKKRASAQETQKGSKISLTDK